MGLRGRQLLKDEELFFITTFRDPLFALYLSFHQNHFPGFKQFINLPGLIIG
jgi:hypothetical protein